MRCPVCMEQGLVSRLTVSQWGMSTDMCYEPYYDEEGKYHSHDPNAFSSGARCSNGHRLHIVRHTPCENCDYNANETSVTYSDETGKLVANYKPNGETWIKVEYTLSLHGELIDVYMTESAANLGRQAHRMKNGWDSPDFKYEDYKIEEVAV